MADGPMSRVILSATKNLGRRWEAPPHQIPRFARNDSVLMQAKCMSNGGPAMRSRAKLSGV